MSEDGVAISPVAGQENGTSGIALPPFAFTNTQILVPEFEYIEPATVAEAAALLAREGERARPIAGGTDLLVQMKMERRTPSCVVNLARIPDLDRLSASDGLEIGATATIRAVERATVVRARYTALGEACRAFSTIQVMVMGTIGGNICNASPAADTVPALLVFDARARIASQSGNRDVPLDEFFTGPGRTVLGSADLLQSVIVPPAAAAVGSAFLKVGRVAADIAKVCVAVRLVRDGARIGTLRIALGAVAPTPRRAREAEGVLTGEAPTVAGIAEVMRQVHAAIAPIDDVRSTAAYRGHVAGVLVADALRLAWERAGGEAIP